MLSFSYNFVHCTHTDRLWMSQKSPLLDLSPYKTPSWGSPLFFLLSSFLLLSFPFNLFLPWSLSRLLVFPYPLKFICFVSLKALEMLTSLAQLTLYGSTYLLSAWSPLFLQPQHPTQQYLTSQMPSLSHLVRSLFFRMGLVYPSSLASLISPKPARGDLFSQLWVIPPPSLLL